MRESESAEVIKPSDLTTEAEVRAYRAGIVVGVELAFERDADARLEGRRIVWDKWLSRLDEWSTLWPWHGGHAPPEPVETVICTQG